MAIETAILCSLLSSSTFMLVSFVCMCLMVSCQFCLQNTVYSKIFKCQVDDVARVIVFLVLKLRMTSSVAAVYRINFQQHLHIQIFTGFKIDVNELFLILKIKVPHEIYITKYFLFFQTKQFLSSRFFNWHRYKTGRKFMACNLNDGRCNSQFQDSFFKYIIIT